MKQLGTLDSAFINLENRITPQHVGGVAIYDPSTAPGGFVRFKDVIQSFERRLGLIPIFRTRLVQVPGDIDRPYWVEDKNFDVEFHVRHISLPKPGDWRQLWIQAARLHARSLDMSRPLWEAYIIEGLDNIPGLPPGAFAMYTKMHHSLVDGAGGQSFMSIINDLKPVPDAVSTPDQPKTVIVDRQPSESELLIKALANKTLGSVQMTKSIVSTTLDVAKYGLAVARDEVPSPDLAAPKTRFNNPVGPHRVAEACVFKLDDMKTIKNIAGVTINDVAMSVISGALRRYMQAKNELPDASMVAGIPLNMRTRGNDTDENNKVGSMFAEIHTNIADPIERLHAVHSSAKIAKEGSENNPMVESLRLAGFFSPALSKSLASIWAKNNLSQYIPLNISTVITNVPGPNFPLYCAGAELVRYHGLGLLTPGCGLFHAVFSSNGIVTVTALADRNSMPDPEFYKECLEDSFDETLKAVNEKANTSRTSAIKKSSKISRIRSRTTKSSKKINGADKRSTKGNPASNPKSPASVAKLVSANSTKKSKPAQAKRKSATANRSATALATVRKTSSRSSATQNANAKKKPGKKKKTTLRDIKIPAGAKRTTRSKSATKKATQKASA